MKFIGKLNVRVALAVLIAIVALSSSFSAPMTVAAQSQGCYPYYTVKAGDNLYRIALAAGTSWQTLMYLNGIYNPNIIYVGQRICLPPAAPGVTATPIVVVTATLRPATLVPTVRPATAVPTTVPNPGGINLPAPGVFPTITLNTYFARVGDTLTIAGLNFPTNEPVDIFFTNLGTPYPASSSGSAVTSATGTLSTTVGIPLAVDGIPLNGAQIGILVKGRVSGYFAYNYFNRLP